MEKLPLYPHLLELAIEVLGAKCEMHDKYPDENEMHKAQYLAKGFQKIIDSEREKFPYLKDEDQIIEVVDYLTVYTDEVNFSDDYFAWFKHTFNILIRVSSFPNRIKPNSRRFQFIKRINKQTSEYLKD
jgi:hypothetical protein